MARRFDKCIVVLLGIIVVVLLLTERGNTRLGAEMQ